MKKIKIGRELTVLVNTCDEYHDVLSIFFCALDDYWNDCPCPIVINTEERKYTYPARVHNYKSLSGVDDWGMRLYLTLKSIDTEFVMMLFDDFILESKVDNAEIEKVLSFLDANKEIAVVYLVDSGLVEKNNSRDFFLKIDDRTDYILNSFPGIWRKEILEKYVKPGDTPWAWELFGSYRTWNSKHEFYSLNSIFDNVYNYNYSKGGAVHRGKWVSSVIEKIDKRYPLNIDWNVRGFTSDSSPEKRTLAWELRFFKVGFKMVGFRAFRRYTKKGFFVTISNAVGFLKSNLLNHS